MLLGAKLGDLEGKVGYREVVFKLSWAILFGHFVAFPARNALPIRTKILSKFLRAMLAPFWGQSTISTAILWPHWCHLCQF